jgi:hypothetical protein
MTFDRSKFSIVVFAVPLFLGCMDAPRSDRITDALQAEPSKVVLDAGVVFSGRPHEICLALPADTIRRADQASAFESSCDCVDLALMDFVDAFDVPC